MNNDKDASPSAQKADLTVEFWLAKGLSQEAAECEVSYRKVRSQVKQTMQQMLSTAPETQGKAAACHDLYKDGDAGAPEQILDRNGQVALNLCKVCGQAEGDLAPSCPGPRRAKGEPSDTTCPDCLGSGTITVLSDDGPHGHPEYVDCPKCCGTGAIATQGPQGEPSALSADDIELLVASIDKPVPNIIDDCSGYPRDFYTTDDLERFATEAVNAAMATQGKAVAGADLDNVPHMIVFDDTERKPEVLIGRGRALKRYEQVSVSWNAHLYVKIDSNSRDCTYPNASIDGDVATQGKAAPELSDAGDIISSLLAVARAAEQAMENTEENDTGLHWNRADFDKLSAAIDVLDALPDDKPGYVLGAAAKAEWALSRRTVPAAPAIVEIADLTRWYCENHPEQEMGHDGCEGAGMPGIISAKVSVPAAPELSDAEILTVSVINDLARAHGSRQESMPRQTGHSYYNFTVKEIHSFARAIEALLYRRTVPAPNFKASLLMDVPTSGVLPVPTKCVICGSDAPHTGTCGSPDPRALCNKPKPTELSDAEIWCLVVI